MDKAMKMCNRKFKGKEKRKAESQTKYLYFCLSSIFLSTNPFFVTEIIIAETGRKKKSSRNNNIHKNESTSLMIITFLSSQYLALLDILTSHKIPYHIDLFKE